MEVIMPPCGVSEVINHHFNYDNLQKYLEYLLHLDKRSMEQIYHLRLKLDEFTDLKQDIIDIKFKLDSHDKKFDEMNIILTNQQVKLIDVEKQAVAFEERISHLEKETAETKKRLPLIEDNLTNLNKITDENCKWIDRMNTSVLGLKNVIEIQSSTIDSHQQSIEIINKDMRTLMNLEESFVEFREKSEQKFEKLKKKDTDLNNTSLALQNKTEEIDHSLTQLTESVTELFKGLSQQGALKPLSKIEHNLEKRENVVVTEGLTSPIIQGSNQIAKTRDAGYQAFYNDFLEYKIKFEKLSNKLNDLKKTIQIKGDGENNNPFIKFDTIEIDNNINTNPNLISITNVKENIIINTPKVSSDTTNNNLNTITNNNIGNNNTQLMKMINVLTENQRLINSNLSLKSSKEELENVIKNMNNEFERFKTSIGEAFSKIETKVKASNEQTITQSIDKEEIILILKDYGKDIIQSEMNGRIVNEINENEILKNTVKRCDTNSEEINKLYESVVDLRRLSMIENKSNINFTDKDFKSLDIKVENIDSALKLLKSKFEENFKGLEEDENSEDNGLNLKDLIRSIKEEMRVLAEKMEKLIGKQENLGADLLGKIRKDLSGESVKLLDEFRNDLRNSIGKIDIQLQSKVDHILLDDFGKKMDTRIQSEISKKIDKSDLKKNNNFITKKIDSLENKISKTLVDTLIDLQLEDAPLIIKKGILGDKCGSCNQVINNGQQTNSQQSYTINVPSNSSNLKVNDENSRHRLRKIQDNSYKYGTGSYSRVLSNANPSTLNDELQLKSNHSKHYINTSVHLPDITNSSISYRKGMGDTPNMRRKEWSVNRDDNKDLSLGNGLTEELDKTIVKADNLIKASIKYYDNIEKKK